MSNRSELAAVGQIGIGAMRIASGLATALGKGLLGAYCGNHQLTSTAMHLAQQAVKGGSEQVKNGWRELNE